jgi:hypothetical protein
MGRSLASRTRFVTKKPSHRKNSKHGVPYLRHKFLQWELWTAAYMLDSWEVVVVFLIFAAAFSTSSYYLLAALVAI